MRQEVLNGLRRQFAGLTQATGAEINLTVEPLFPMLKNDPELTDQAVQVLQALLGPERLQLLHPAMGSEDFPYFAARAPGFYFFWGFAPPEAGARPSTPPTSTPTKRRCPAASRPRGAAGLPGRAGVPFPGARGPVPQEEDLGVM